MVNKQHHGLELTLRQQNLQGELCLQFLRMNEQESVSLHCLEWEIPI